MRHPAEYYIKFLLVRHPGISDAELMKRLSDLGFLSIEDKYYTFLKQQLPTPPAGFNPNDWSHRPSMSYLRELGIYELFHPDEAVNGAWAILTAPDQRLVVEQILLSKLADPVHLKSSLLRINKTHSWHLTDEAVTAYGKFFWNAKLLTFDDWGRFLYGRTSLYERHMAFLQGAATDLVLFHLSVEQNVESKQMIQDAQKIAHFTLKEVALKPGTGADKVKAIGVLSKTIVECHEALSTSDMALKDVLKQFERFRMEHHNAAPADIRQLAPKGNYTGSGAYEKLPN